MTCFPWGHAIIRGFQGKPTRHILPSHRDRLGCGGPIFKIRMSAWPSFQGHSEYVKFSSVQQKLETLQASKTVKTVSEIEKRFPSKLLEFLLYRRKLYIFRMALKRGSCRHSNFKNRTTTAQTIAMWKKYMPSIEIEKKKTRDATPHLLWIFPTSGVSLNLDYFCRP